MEAKTKVNSGASIKSVPVACRYPEDRIGLLDAITKRRGFGDRSETMRHALDRLIEEHFPGATNGAGVKDVR